MNAAVLHGKPPLWMERMQVTTHWNVLSNHPEQSTGKVWHVSTVGVESTTIPKMVVSLQIWRLSNGLAVDGFQACRGELEVCSTVPMEMVLQ